MNRDDAYKGKKPTEVDLIVDMNWSATISMYSLGGVTADSRYSTAELYVSNSELSFNSSIFRISELGSSIV